MGLVFLLFPLVVIRRFRLDPVEVLALRRPRAAAWLGVLIGAPAGLALAVGLVFGFFHFQIFRIPATAFIGVVLTMVTLLTGSIFPAIAWHALNNGLAVYLAPIEFDSGGDLWWTFGGFVGLPVAFLIIWRNRTPCPDVGPRKRP